MLRRVLAGAAAGLLGAAALVGTHGLALGVTLGMVTGALYTLATRPTPFAYLERAFTAAALAIPLWLLLSVIALPVLAGGTPQWDAAGMRGLLGQLVGWVLYGATLGLVVQGLEDATGGYLGVAAPAAPVMAKPPTRIVVLGGGFGGMTTAERLERELGADPSVQLTLVSDTNALLFTPMLAEVAGGGVEPSHISSPLRTALRRTDVVRGRIVGVDLEQRCVRVTTSHESEPRALEYDQLVFALGSTSNYFGNDNVRKHAFDFKTLLDAIRIRNHVIDMFERANQEDDETQRRACLTFVIAGGGFAGVELAGALNDLARGIVADYPRLRPEEIEVVLVHSRDTILPELSATLGDYACRTMTARGVRFALGHRVTDAREGVVVLDDRELLAHTLVWTAGTTPNPLLKECGLTTDKRGAVVVDKTLAVTGHPHLWALGDCAAVVDGKTDQPCPPTAQFALREGRVLARNLRRVLRGAPAVPFHFASLGALCVVGYQTACAELSLPWPFRRSVRFSGLIAWLMWRAIYVSKLPGTDRKVRVLIDWAIELFFPRDIVQTIDLT